MVKSNARPEFRPKRRFSAHLGYRLLFLIGVPTLYCLISIGGREVQRLYTQEQHTGRQLLWHVEELNAETPQNCTPPAVSEFPPDLFTPQQRKAGAVVIHVIVCCYLFVMLALICDDYFVPCIQRMCECLNMSEDVAGATFMAAAVSSPELFINVVGTFITEGDIGVGTVVGSAVFNVLAVPACCGLFSNQVVKLNWWSLSRDCGIYSVTVVALITTLWDGRIEWYEALMLVLLYIFYILAMYYNVEVRQWVSGCCRKRHRGGYKLIPENVISSETNPLIARSISGSKLSKFEVTTEIQGSEQVKCNSAMTGMLYTNGNIKGAQVAIGGVKEVQFTNGNIKGAEITTANIEEDVSDEEIELCNWPTNKGFCKQFWWILIRPIAIILAATIPNCRSGICKRFYLLTFTMCVMWIGAASYMVAWMITIIGDTLQIPDSVMGLTFMAAGMSVPEAVSSVIVTNQGHGSMGISNSIGSNTFDILLCLGLPWLIKSTFLPTIEGQHYVRINSGGMGYSVISLFSTLFLLYVTFLCSDFKLDHKVGAICLFIYAVFLIMAALIELNIFFPVNLPVCSRAY